MLSARQILARNIRFFRKSYDWSQEDLADHCGLHRTYIGAIERCEQNVSVDNIEKIAVALKIKPWLLMKPRHTPPFTRKP